MTPTIPATPDTVAADLARFIEPGQVTELRAMHVGAPNRIFAGWFTGDPPSLRRMAKTALNLGREAAWVYFIPNPIKPDLHARCPDSALNFIKGKTVLTRDSDIIEQRTIIIDIDPARTWLPDSNAPLPDPAGPTHDSEFAFALDIAVNYIQPFLTEFGFLNPIPMCSGNGVHLAYRLQQPVPLDAIADTDPFASLLTVLASRFDCYGATVDRNTSNPIRMLKVPGTMVRKGPSTPNRPHRMARVLDTQTIAEVLNAHGFRYTASTADNTATGPASPASFPGEPATAPPTPTHIP